MGLKKKDDEGGGRDRGRGWEADAKHSRETKTKTWYGIPAFWELKAMSEGKKGSNGNQPEVPKCQRRNKYF